MKAQKLSCFAHKTQERQGWGSGCPIPPVLFLSKGDRAERMKDDEDVEEKSPVSLGKPGASA